ncbi:MAG: GPW/gp25 family protein [Candidatus Spyradenecus sp.]
MNYNVTLDGSVDFAPPSEAAEILQNVRTILTTTVGTVPLHRDFGVATDFLDSPLPVAKTLMRAAVIDAIEAFEPRARVVEVTFEDDDEAAMAGILKPRVTLSIGDEDEAEEA